MNEIFKPWGVSGYEVSNRGRIKRIGGGQGFRPGKFLSPNKSSNGYLQVRLTTDGSQKVIAVHKLVAEVFFGKRPNGLHIRHLDGNKQNNSVDNLRYGTAKENGEDSARLGVMPKGEHVNTSVLTNDQAVNCIELLNEGMTPTQIAKSFNLPRNAIYKIKYGKTWQWLQQANNRAEGKATQ